MVSTSTFFIVLLASLLILSSARLESENSDIKSGSKVNKDDSPSLTNSAIRKGEYVRREAVDASRLNNLDMATKDRSWSYYYPYPSYGYARREAVDSSNSKNMDMATTDRSWSYYNPYPSYAYRPEAVDTANSKNMDMATKDRSWSYYYPYPSYAYRPETADASRSGNMKVEIENSPYRY